MEEALIVAGILGPVISGLLQMIKQADFVNSRWLPIVAVIVGIVFGGIYAVLFNEVLPIYLLGGLIGGLASGGFYNGVQAVKGEE